MMSKVVGVALKAAQKFAEPLKSENLNVWVSDTSVYPLFAVWVFDAALIAFYTLKTAIVSPDVQIRPSNRHSFLRGNLKGFDQVKEVNRKQKK